MWRNLLLTSIVFCLSLGILYSTLLQLDPLGEQKAVAYLALFFGGFSAIWSFFTIFFFFGAELFSGYKLGNKVFLTASRRAFWIGLLAMALSALQILRLLGIEEVILLLVFFGLLEWIFMTGMKN